MHDLWNEWPVPVAVPFVPVLPAPDPHIYEPLSGLLPMTYPHRLLPSLHLFPYTFPYPWFENPGSLFPLSGTAPDTFGTNVPLLPDLHWPPQPGFPHPLPVNLAESNSSPAVLQIICYFTVSYGCVKYLMADEPGFRY